MNYHGVHCPVCNKELSETDDIVVCPECGTPYHRECYLKAGHCVMEDLHREHRDWENPNDLKNRSVTNETIIMCPSCGQPNSAENTVCEHCGKPLMPSGTGSAQQSEAQAKAAAFNTLFEEINPQSSIQDVPVREIVAFTQANSNYFVRLFKLLSMRVTSTIFNWSAFFFGPMYFFYRKMYRPGMVALGAWLAIRIPTFMLAYRLIPQAVANPALLQTLKFDLTGCENLLFIANVFSFLPFILHVMCGFMANKLYYKHAMSALSLIHKQLPNASQSELDQVIMHRGGISFGACLLASLGVMAVVFIVSMIIATAIVPTATASILPVLTLL